MALTDAEKQMVKDCFNEWAARHPDPHGPAIMTHFGPYSPRQYAREVTLETSIGRERFKMIEYIMHKEKLDIKAALKPARYRRGIKRKT